MIKREEALTFLNKNIPEKNIIKHLLATEAIMKALALRLEPEKEAEYALAGLLHDGDYRADVPIQLQGIKVSQLLEKEGFVLSQSVKQAMAAHNWENTGVKPESKMDWALYCCDSLTGLIVAVTLVRPEKKIKLVELKNIQKKWKEKSFAAGTRRKDIALCEEKLGIPLPEFIDLSLKAMQAIDRDLGL